MNVDEKPVELFLLLNLHEKPFLMLNLLGDSQVVLTDLVLRQVWLNCNFDPKFRSVEGD